MDRELLIMIAKNQLMAIPRLAERRNKQILQRGYVPWKSKAEYVEWVFDNCRANITRHRDISGTVLEIGPGGNVATTMLFLKAGCERGYCIDVFPFLREQDELYNLLDRDYRTLLERIEYRFPEDIAQSTLPDASCDIIFSAACLEHVPDPLGAVNRIAALLKPGGVTTHGIDLRDHRDMSRPLRFLRYSEWMWRAATSRRVHTNRLRASDWQHAFESAGLTNVEVVPAQTVDLREGARSRMHPRFQSKTVEDLSTVQIEITATKPG